MTDTIEEHKKRMRGYHKNLITEDFWLNIYERPDYAPYNGKPGFSIVPTRKEADRQAGAYNAHERIACIPIKFRRGDGLEKKKTLFQKIFGRGDKHE